MPVMNGYEAAAAIRHSEREDAASICIFALTANAFHDDIEHALHSGMDAVLTKPLELQVLLEKLAKLEKGRYYEENTDADVRLLYCSCTGVYEYGKK